jgi:hypothetical protein
LLKLIRVLDLFYSHSSFLSYIEKNLSK